MDIFNYLANKYKRISKIMYIILLLLAVGQTTFTVYGQNFPSGQYSIPNTIFN